MTEAEQMEELDVIRAHHFAACGRDLPAVQHISEPDHWGQRFACSTCGTTVTALYPHRGYRRLSCRYGLVGKWGTIGPPTPQNATNPTASAGT